MAKNTRIQLKDAWRKLALEKNMDSITVLELAEEANINIKTFYYHFHSMADFLNWMYSTRFYEMVEEEGVTVDNWSNLMIRVLSSLRNNIVYFSSVIGSKYEAQFWQASSKLIEYGTEKYIIALMKKWEEESNEKLVISEEQLKYLVRYHSMGFYGVAEQWFREGMKLSDEEIMSMFYVLSNDSIFHALKIMNNVSFKDLYSIQ